MKYIHTNKKEQQNNNSIIYNRTVQVISNNKGDNPDTIKQFNTNRIQKSKQF